MASTSGTLEVQIFDEELLRRVMTGNIDWTVWQILTTEGILPPVSGSLPHQLLPKDVEIWCGRAEEGGFFVTNVTKTDLGLRASIGFVSDPPASPTGSVDWSETGLFPGLKRLKPAGSRTYVSRLKDGDVVIIIRP